MPLDSDAGPRSAKPLRSYAVVVFALIIGLFLGVLCVGSIGWVMLAGNSGQALLSHVWSAVTGRTLSIDVSQPTVVDRIQRLQRLETVVYTVDKIVTGAKENPIFPDFLAGDRLLMLVHGEVIAGIDFTDLKPGDVRLNGKQIQLHLPAPQVFRTRIDSAKTRVYSRQTGLLVPTDPNLETQVRQEAERQLQEAAMADGILRTAQQNAASTIRSLLQGLGFEKIDFD
ncbi:MAG TPA: DUF4230 domain-containing protein [Candidatus Sulfotelmatobacter sp.]|jgi:hypothetical protein|nr:DUF4230 domain-containing protein [Candidatus Sulfotelmatobacter sp.]